MNIKKHLIIANFLQILYVIVNLLGVILGFFDGEKIIFLSMFWYIFIVPIHTINFPQAYRFRRSRFQYNA